MNDIFKVRGGKLYQWDTGRILSVSPGRGEIINEVHFATDDETALVLEIKTDSEGMYVNIPNSLMQLNGYLHIWGVLHLPDGRQTIVHSHQRIRQRARPDDYVYTETDIMDYRILEAGLTQLEARVDDIEKSVAGDFYTKAEIDAIMGSYIADIDALVGGDE
ncbi:MAG: hypothetical protein IJC56_02430 [Clostridia bacterium]|nr:hypothetical protein [Clostridia bacterium]